jgi:hypothetical protein
MNRSMRMRPSPPMVVAVIALIAALAGTALADQTGSTSAVGKKKVKKIAVKQIRKLAPELSVANADTANSAKTANSAESAKTANSANNSSALQGASLASIAAGNDAFISDCNPNTETFVQCGGSNGGAQLTLARESKVLVIYGWRWSDDATSDGIALGTCQTTRNGAATSGAITMGEGLNWPPDPAPDPEIHQHTGGSFDYAGPPVVDVVGPLQPGTHRFGLRCNDELSGDMRYTGIRIAALVMGTG